MTAAIRMTPQAVRHASEATAWWKRNRPAAPGLFRRELTFVLKLLRAAPEIGAPHPSEVRSVRRVLLPHTQYHLYYVHDVAARTIVILAVWSSRRGAPPPLGPG